MYIKARVCRARYKNCRDPVGGGGGGRTRGDLCIFYRYQPSRKTFGGTDSHRVFHFFPPRPVLPLSLSRLPPRVHFSPHSLPQSCPFYIIPRHNTLAPVRVYNVPIYFTVQQLLYTYISCYSLFSNKYQKCN